jgi:hypothetical protein
MGYFLVYNLGSADGKSKFSGGKMRTRCNSDVMVINILDLAKSCPGQALFPRLNGTTLKKAKSFFLVNNTKIGRSTFLMSNNF